MARLRDVPTVLRSFGIWAFVRRIIQQISEDGLYTWASALAYSWLFAVFPFLIFLLTLVPYLPQHARDEVENAVTNFTNTTLGSAAATINDNVMHVTRLSHRGWLGISLLLSLWAASGGMSMTMSALDQCYDIKSGRPFYKHRPLAILLTFCVIVMVLAVTILLPVGTATENFLLARHLLTTPVAFAFNFVRYLLAVTLMISVLSIVYHFGPCIKHRFEFVSPGAVFSIIVWFLLDFSFRFYVDKYARYERTYGTVGGVAILLLFFYIDALVLLIGAEINSEIDFEILGVKPGTRDLRKKQGVATEKDARLAEEL